MELEKYLETCVKPFDGRYQELVRRMAGEEYFLLTALWQRMVDGTAEEGDVRKTYELMATKGVMPYADYLIVEQAKAIVPRVLEQVPEEGTIVDVGCCDGLLTNYYALCRPRARFVGVDLCEQTIGLARKQAATLGLQNIHYSCGSFLSIPLRVVNLAIATFSIHESGYRSNDEPARRHSSREKGYDKRETDKIDELMRIAQKSIISVRQAENSDWKTWWTAQSSVHHWKYTSSNLACPTHQRILLTTLERN